jgi:TolA-binding protein
VVVGTRFDVEVCRDLSTVVVLEGAVRVESSAASVQVGAGSSVRSDDARFQAPATPTQAAPARMDQARDGFEARARRPIAQRIDGHETLSASAAQVGPATECASLKPVALRKACYERVAQGKGLAAQNALYALGTLARDVEGNMDEAVRFFRRYSERFPDGLFAPEALLGLLDSLEKQGRIREAIQAAESYERRYADDERTPRVALQRARMLCASERRGEGLLIAAEVARTHPGLQETAARVRVACEPMGAQGSEHSLERPQNHPRDGPLPGG